MTDKELRRLNRKELLEMLIEQEKENERLREEIDRIKAKKDLKTNRMKEAGTLAEAWVSVSGALEAADKAAKSYLDDIKRLYEEAKSEHDRIIDEAVEISKTIILQSGKKGTEEDEKSVSAKLPKPRTRSANKKLPSVGKMKADRIPEEKDVGK